MPPTEGVVLNREGRELISVAKVRVTVAEIPVSSLKRNIKNSGPLRHVNMGGCIADSVGYRFS